MRIAFYAPMKPPSHPTPSGDRQIARLFIAALEMAGHQVELASELRSHDPMGDPAHQRAIREEAAEATEALIAVCQAHPDQMPQLWLTYHLYHKAPDHLGPAVAAALNIPYVAAEASYAPKQAGGPWDAGHRAVADALRQAAAVVYLNPQDQPCVAPLLRAGTTELVLAPFIELPQGSIDRAGARADVTARTGRADASPWLLAVGMMRADAKRDSYLVLAEALEALADQDWRLLVVGDGPARAEIEGAFAGLADRIDWLGEVPPEALPAIYAAADLLVWPGINEALGLSVLEAQAAGLPAVVGDGGALPTIVADDETGSVTPEGDAGAFATAVRALLTDTPRRVQMAGAARRKAKTQHSLDSAAARLDEVVRNAVESYPT